MSAVKICGAGLLCLVALLCIKNLRENFVPLVRFAAAVIFVGSLLGMISPLISFWEGAIAKSQVEKYTTLIFKALGIAYLTNITAQICRDCGENGIAGGVETVGKIELLLLALPLLSEVLLTAEEMLSW